MGNIVFGDYVYVSLNLKFLIQLLDLKIIWNITDQI